MVFYMLLGIKPFIVMLFEVSVMLWAIEWYASNFSNLMMVSIIVFAIAWVFQFVGHKIEGKKPSFLEDLTFLLIGPLWVGKDLFRL